MSYLHPTLLRALKHVRDNPPNCSRWGICRLVAGYVRETSIITAYDVTEGLSNVFRKMGYDSIYPVYDPADRVNTDSRAQYENLENLWAGKQRELRLALLDECIAYLENLGAPTVQTTSQAEQPE